MFLERTQCTAVTVYADNYVSRQTENRSGYPTVTASVAGATRLRRLLASLISNRIASNFVATDRCTNLLQALRAVIARIAGLLSHTKRRVGVTRSICT